MLKNDRTICKNSYNKKQNRNNFYVSGKDSKDLSGSKKKFMDDKLSVLASRNHRQLMIGPSNVGKAYYMSKMLEKTGNKRPLLIKNPISQ